MKTYQAEITIDASAEAIWNVLVDTDNYAEWDPGMIRIEGDLAPGGKVKFFTKFSPDQAFAVKVTGFEPGKKMVLTGGMPFGLFKSERTHTLKENTDGRTHFHTIESFSGLLYPLFGKQIPDLTESFNNFVTGLKARAEGTAT